MMMCVVERRRTGDAVVRMMIIEERMIGRGGTDDVRLIIEKIAGREEIGLMIVRVVKHGTLLICTRPGNGTGSASDRHDCQS
jgi:hypothetical protein